MNEAATMFAERAIEWAKESTQSVGWVERSDTHRRALAPHSIHRNAVLATHRRRCAELVALVPIFPQEPHRRRTSYNPGNRSISEINRSITRNSNSAIGIEADAAATTLFGKARQSVLAILFEDPDSAYHLRELARKTGVSPDALQQEMTQLSKADLVIRRQDGNRVTYRANASHPIFPELQSIIRKTCGLPVQIKGALEPCYRRIGFATLYGSFAKGANHARSDVDLLIVGDLRLEEILASIVAIEERVGREISVRLYSPEDFQSRAQGDAFLNGVLNPLLGSVDDA